MKNRVDWMKSLDSAMTKFEEHESHELTRMIYEKTKNEALG